MKLVSIYVAANDAVRLLLVVFAAIAHAGAQYIVGAPCHTTSIEQSVDNPGLMGVWYEQERYNVVFETGDTCIKMTNTDNGDGSFSVLFEGIESDGTPSNMSGVATYVDPSSGEGLLTLEIPQVGLNVPLTIVDTDYTSFSVMFSCKSLPGSTSSQMAWVHTRERFPSQATMDAARAVVTANALDQVWIDVEQENCTN